MELASKQARGGGRVQRDPHPSLRPFVVEYCGMTRDLAAMGGFTITPDCFGELICCSDPLVMIRGGQRETLPTCFLLGLLNGPLRVEAKGVIRCIAARLHPWLIGRFLATDPDFLSRCWMPVKDLLGARLDVVRKMLPQGPWQSLFETMDALWLDLVGGWPGEQDRGLVRRFLEDGPPSTAGIAQRCGVTSRQLERRVRTLTGTSPKQLACLRRFEKARNAIGAEPSINLAHLAIDAGYSDQPHMTRAFRRYAGQTPAQFARESLARKKWLAALDVAFVQERTTPPG